jgi:hypothetical protein
MTEAGGNSANDAGVHGDVHGAMAGRSYIQWLGAAEEPAPAPYRRRFISHHYRSLTRSPACRKAAAPMFCVEEVPTSRTHRDLILEKAE